MYALEDEKYTTDYVLSLLDGAGKTDYSKLSMEIPKELVPRCPVCGEPMR